MRSLEMAAPAARPFDSRFRNLVAFVAIVWGVATTFVAFDMVALGGVDLVLSYPALFGDIALSRTVTQSTSCEVRPATRRTGARPPSTRVRPMWARGCSVLV